MKKPPPVEYLQHLFSKDKYAELVEAAGILLEEQPEHVRGLYWRACALMRLDKMDDALNDLDAAIDLYDEYADAYSQRGVIFFHKGELQMALDDMNKAVKLEPENPYRYSSRAYIKSSLDKVESAIEDYEKAIKLDPEDAVAHNNLGLLQEKLGYKSKAQRNFEHADRLMVNEDGELIKKPHEVTEPSPLVEDVSKETPTYGKILKDLFTRKGFLEYLNFLKQRLTGK